MVRLVFDRGRRPSSFYLLVASTATLFVTDAAYGYALLNGTFHHQLIYDAGWIGFYLLWGATALDPTMPVLTEATPDRERRLTTRRLAVLSIASLMAPAMQIVQEAHTGNLDLLVFSAASMVLFMLVIVRVVGLARQHERAVSRERALADAAVALVSAVSEDEVRAVALEGSGDADRRRRRDPRVQRHSRRAHADRAGRRRAALRGHRGAAGSCDRHAPGRTRSMPGRGTSLASRCSPCASRCSR